MSRARANHYLGADDITARACRRTRVQAAYLYTEAWVAYLLEKMKDEAEFKKVLASYGVK